MSFTSLAAFDAAAQSVAILDGADDPVDVKANGRQVRHYRLLPGKGDRLLIRAQGPVVVSLRLRGITSSTATGTFRILRDETWASDNAFELSADSSAVIGAGAPHGSRALSEELQFHIEVPEGEREFSLSLLEGTPILVRVLKTRQANPSLAAAPERPLERTLEKEPDRDSDPEPASPELLPKPSMDSTTTPMEPTISMDAATAAPAVDSIPAVVSNSTENDGKDGTAPPQPVVRLPPPQLHGNTLLFDESPGGSQPGDSTLRDATQLPLKEGPPPRVRGFALGLRAGALGYVGQSSSSATSPEAIRLAFPVSLELAWDFNPTWAIFLEGGWHRLVTTERRTNPQDPDFPELHSRTRMDVAPASLGATWARHFGEHFGIRFRLGATAAWVESRSSVGSSASTLTKQPLSTCVGVGGVAGLGLELKAGPGRVSVEGRYQRLYSVWGDSNSGLLDNVHVVAGYRLEL